ncbi:hypothetical protein OV079_08010 [Nannocystis pusilla]|uniref:Uncharacterized protein n=1 Tax=Nannocystis pusilla TaxID=889268 RepID=A0A9X3IX76_9BACT|nr:hypothetical protein [Nannocystis pusilla]
MEQLVAGELEQVVDAALAVVVAVEVACVDAPRSRRPGLRLDAEDAAGQVFEAAARAHGGVDEEGVAVVGAGGPEALDLVDDAGETREDEVGEGLAPHGQAHVLARRGEVGDREEAGLDRGVEEGVEVGEIDLEVAGAPTLLAFWVGGQADRGPAGQQLDGDAERARVALGDEEQLRRVEVGVAGVVVGGADAEVVGVDGVVDDQPLPGAGGELEAILGELADLAGRRRRSRRSCGCCARTRGARTSPGSRPASRAGRSPRSRSAPGGRGRGAPPAAGR